MNVSIRNNKGFSLIELMVVVAIIGVLAAIAVPNYQRFTAKSKQAEAKASLSALYGATTAFRSEWQTFSSSFAAIGYAPTGWQRYEHGWTANFPAAAPSGYSGPAIAAPNNTTALCGLGGPITATPGCAVINSPNAPGAVSGTSMTATAFVAQARAHIGNAAGTIDQWTIDQTKNISNTTDGLP